ncbi:hypothetical protein Agabi119p4_7311 [Agaricus bisporus var. burnettii]|uniref:Lipoyl-binding domain-containing protein n=1 Tax=Agaricus bisporus var. burnettii TaxID=192524 RepID=A0A8H7C7I1_AGABI|nr:hypothetical protein AGABI2DRAFT_119444 [Agaricus bisporus var. bisporus H97]EKV45771.1 hypothetical protein AGABI2DRAFT_119444 [Agaricus bisporus var. bisporus H97]KAF7768068.1 hypothetical protein Agabi119p4_7311 [Agaricus bisporus var. burnettii]
MSRSLTTVARAAAISSKSASAQAYDRCGGRGFHGSLRRQAILMPAMSPLMNEGTITRWKKREGESFVPGDVLLQIESDIATIDVEAHSPGILGKILLQDGATNVPIEQAIALVARDQQELSTLQLLDDNMPMSPPLNFIPTPPSTSANPIWRRPASHKSRVISSSYISVQGARKTTPLSTEFTVRPTIDDVTGTSIRRKIVVNLRGSPLKA